MTRMGRILGRIAALFVASMGVAGCGLAFKPPTVTVAEVRLASINLTGGSVLVQLDVLNPNRYALASEDFRYALAFASGAGDTARWNTLAEGHLPDTIRIPARETGRVDVVVPFDLAAVGAALRRLLGQGELEYRFSGELRAGTPLGSRRIPFDQRGIIRP